MTRSESLRMVALAGLGILQPVIRKRTPFAPVSPDRDLSFGWTTCLIDETGDDGRESESTSVPELREWKSLRIRDSLIDIKNPVSRLIPVFSMFLYGILARGWRYCVRSLRQENQANFLHRNRMTVNRQFHMMTKLMQLSFLAFANTLVAGDNNWPSFRGQHAAGVANAQNLPDTWDAATGENILWKVRIPGLAHASPVIWGERLFVTSALSSKGEASFRRGQYGDGDASDDRSVHKWNVYCLNKRTGEMLWERTAVEAKPIDKRHIKATYNNSTPATNGELLIAFFGSQGVYAYSAAGDFLWKKELGRLDVGAYDAPDYEWGSASSPIIYKNLVILQCDTQKASFIIGCELKTGDTVWKTERNELPSWGTPTIYPGEKRAELITNSSNFIYGYDPMTGKELWRLGGSSNLTTPTPVFKDDIIVVASGRRPTAPLYAIRSGATGDITLEENQTSNGFVLWRKLKRGPNMATPIIYGRHLYALQNQGILDCYELETGEEMYRQRLPHHGSGFSASPVAADGRIYLPAEDGQIFVVKAGPQYELIAENELGESLMASPALSDGILYVRAKDHLFAIGKK